MPNDSPIWAITSYYNPVGYKSRFENYQIFKQTVEIPLVTVELSFTGEFQLTENDCDILVQISGGDVMFQKERLLNIALSHVPDSVPYVAWWDCDLYLEKNWWCKAAEELEKHKMIQLFSEFYDLPPNTLPMNFDTKKVVPHLPTAKILQGGFSAAEVCKRKTSRSIEGGHLFGVAWAGHTKTMKKYGLYDAQIVGGGDRAVCYAALGQFDLLRTMLEFNDKRWKHYLDWSRLFYSEIKGDIGFIEASAFHLWHGEIVNRQYFTRHEEFYQYNFDPTIDIALSDEGAWRWNSDKPEMHRFFERFFQKRSEDLA